MRFTRILSSIVGVAMLGGWSGCFNEDCWGTDSAFTVNVPRPSPPVNAAAGAAGEGSTAATAVAIESQTGQYSWYSCAKLCPYKGSVQMRDCSNAVVDGEEVVSCFYKSERRCTESGEVVEGRRPPGLQAPVVGGRDTGGLLALMAHLELASVHAFRRLARELESFDAPEDLRQRTHQAIRDEVRHARAARRLAIAHGARPIPVQLQFVPQRSLLEIAIDNEIEGCIRETFGATVALWQAQRASTPELRAHFAAIARDEVEHARLAWDLRLWLKSRLPAASQRALDTARDRALLELRREVESGQPTPATTELGLPTPWEGGSLLAGLAGRLVELEAAA